MQFPYFPPYLLLGLPISSTALLIYQELFSFFHMYCNDKYKIEHLLILIYNNIFNKIINYTYTFSLTDPCFASRLASFTASSASLIACFLASIFALRFSIDFACVLGTER